MLDCGEGNDVAVVRAGEEVQLVSCERVITVTASSADESA